MDDILLIRNIYVISLTLRFGASLRVTRRKSVHLIKYSYTIHIYLDEILCDLSTSYHELFLRSLWITVFWSKMVEASMVNGDVGSFEFLLYKYHIRAFARIRKGAVEGNMRNGLLRRI